MFLLKFEKLDFVGFSISLLNISLMHHFVLGISRYSIFTILLFSDLTLSSGTDFNGGIYKELYHAPNRTDPL